MVRITFLLNTNQQIQSVVLCNKVTLLEIHKLAKNKLKVSSLRIFSQSGAELKTDSELIETIGESTQITLLISIGEDYVGSTKALQEPTDTETYDKCIQKILAIDSFIDPEAAAQLRTCSSLKGVEYAIGMPDLHPGSKFPVGAAFATRGWIYPPLIGGDIGCGMTFLYLDGLKSANFKPQQIANALTDLDSNYTGDMSNILEQFNIESSPEHDIQLGTIGGGNHFAELQQVQSIVNEDLFTKSGLTKDFAFLLVHSGSRGLGQSILDSHSKNFGSGGLKVDSPDAQNYLADHDRAVLWGKANRKLISQRFLEYIEYDIDQAKLVLDVTHNSVVQKEFGDGTIRWLHRKGAAPSDQGLVVIPGSRGDYSYLVSPRPNVMEETCFSLAHGAGRKWSRSMAKKKLRDKYGKSAKAVAALQSTKFGGAVVCEDKDLLVEEAPDAYKSCASVVGDLGEFVEIVAILEPVVTYKTRK